MQNKKARRRALCGTLSTLLFEDEVGGDRSQPQQRGIVVTHSDSRSVITQDTHKDSRQAKSAKAKKFRSKYQGSMDPTPPSEGIKKPMINYLIFLIPGRAAENANMSISVVDNVPEGVDDAKLIGRRRTRRRALYLCSDYYPLR